MPLCGHLWHCKRADVKNHTQHWLWLGMLLWIFPPHSASPVEHWLLPTVECILQLSNMIGLSRGPEKALLLEPMLKNERHTLFNKHGDQSLRATLGFVQHCLVQVLPKDTCSHATQTKRLTRSGMANNVYVYQRGLGPLFNTFINNFTELHDNLTSSEWSPYDSAYGSDPLLHVTLRVGHEQEGFMTHSCSILLSAPPWNQNFSPSW